MQRLGWDRLEQGHARQRGADTVIALGAAAGGRTGQGRRIGRTWAIGLLLLSLVMIVAGSERLVAGTTLSLDELFVAVMGVAHLPAGAGTRQRTHLQHAVEATYFLSGCRNGKVKDVATSGLWLVVLLPGAPSGLQQRRERQPVTRTRAQGAVPNTSRDAQE
jgi:hypothetical protein